MRKLIAASIVGLGLLFAPFSDAAETGSYLNFDVGVNFAHDISIFGSEIPMDPGFRIGIAPGININEFFAVELDTGFVYNEPEASDQEWFGHVPFIAQAIFRHEFDGGLTIFGGPGAGGAVSFIEAEDIIGGGTEDDTTFTFAWQFQTGLRFQINENFGIGAVYKYLGLLDPEFELFGVDFDVENVHNHYIGVQFHMGF